MLEIASLLAGSVLYLSIANAFDYVIVGGGAAGLTVAGRLSDDPSVTVAVIEAGFNAENLPEVFIPGAIGTGISFSTLNWRYPTISQKNLNGRNITVNAGKALGGSTVINSMIFPRAEKEQYDVWATLNNSTQWGWDDLLPYFKKTEKFQKPNEYQSLVGGARFDPAFHGFDGRVQVGFPNFFFNQSALWRQASERLGFQASPDLANGNPHAVGVSSNSIDADNNTRCSAACAYYTPFQDRPNLHVFLNSTVTRIIWSNTSLVKGLASGVEYINNGQLHTIEAEKEVILSAGTVGSPKVLELSGVGNETILRKAGIEPYINLPTVGENLADHVHSWANAFTNASFTKDLLLLNTTFADEQKVLWFKNRTGFYSAIPRSLGIAAPSDVFNSSVLDILLEEGRVQVETFAGRFSNGNEDLKKGISRQLDLALDLYQRDKELPLELNLEPGYSGPTPFDSRPKRLFSTINSVLYAPLSRGRTHITSNDPFAFPALDPAYWSHPIDVAAQVAGIKLARKMLTTEPMLSIYQGEFEPGLDKQSDEKIENWLRGVVQSDNHETGSCSMMPKEYGGVVDTSLRVYGLSNVRVIDASVIPFPISAHLSSTIYAIGEKAADIIRSNR